MLFSDVSGTPRSLGWVRLLNLPNLFTALWVAVLFWGERWAFQSSIRACKWNSWERWPHGATPHHLILLADPQLIDPHTYPDRRWPLSSLTLFHTDYYIRRSYTQLARSLHPDTLIFLGDLFDGGREWKTARGNIEDPAWAKGLRPSGERAYAETWGQRYGEDFWLQEYQRFGDIFYDLWNLGGGHASKGQRGRKIIANIPGNHDLGFGAQIKLPVRNRFESYFGSGNRVDVIGNHTFVSVDSVSLSAGSSNRPKEETAAISGPVEEFLTTVQATKRRAVIRELGYIAGEEKVVQQSHLVEELDKVESSHIPTLDPGPGGPDLPTILLTHVPLYRDPGTPCGPLREHFPPSKPPPGQQTPVVPDDRNAIRVAAGYQYQNTLGEEDSITLMSSIGNVGYVFSGDDHDYCEVVHPSNKNYAREITVKSMSYAMGIRKPGFVMLSMWNPIDETGRSVLQSQHTGHGAPSSDLQPQTIQTHLCLLPDQLGILINYALFAALTVLALFIHVFLFSNPSKSEAFFLLPTSTKDLIPTFSTSTSPKEKSEPPDRTSTRHDHTDSNSSTSSTSLTALAPRTGKIAAATRGRSLSPGGGYGLPANLGTGLAPVVWDREDEERKGMKKGYKSNGFRDKQGARRRRTVMKEVLREVLKVALIAGVLFVWLNITG